MSVIDTLITDRTEDDVLEWERLRSLGVVGMTSEELAKWNAGLKGEYKASDFNRVSEAYNYLCEILKSIFIISSYDPLKTTWQKGDTPLSDDREEYIQKISTLKESVNADGDMPSTLDALTYEGANNIERVLQNVQKKIEELDASLIYAGQYYAGEV